VVVLIGIVITKFVDGLWWMDSVLGVFCALAIFYAAYKIMVEAVTKILGEAPKQEFIDELCAEVKKIYDNDLQLHHFHLHNYITHKELTLHLMLDKNETVENGHTIATAIDEMIMAKYGIESTIHIEPLEHQ
jgi:divalent metal cation (Fe/Co/Zn/Cd) transporter